MNVDFSGVPVAQILASLLGAAVLLLGTVGLLALMAVAGLRRVPQPLPMVIPVRALPINRPPALRPRAVAWSSPTTVLSRPPPTFLSGNYGSFPVSGAPAV